MKSLVTFTMLIIAAFSAAALAQSNIDGVSFRAWGENLGWTDWRNANATASGVHVGSTFLSGYVWAENVGWINLGNEAPTNGTSYSNTDGSDAGVNIGLAGSLNGLAWGENVGWINFNAGAQTEPPQRATIGCDGRLHGMVWSENAGWINLSLTNSGQFVAVDAQTQPLACDINHDGVSDGRDIQVFTDLLLHGGSDWRDICSGDVGPATNGAIDLDDVVAFTACLLN